MQARRALGRYAHAEHDPARARQLAERLVVKAQEEVFRVHILRHIVRDDVIYLAPRRSATLRNEGEGDIRQKSSRSSATHQLQRSKGRSGAKRTIVRSTLVSILWKCGTCACNSCSGCPIFSESKYEPVRVSICTTEGGGEGERTREDDDPADEVDLAIGALAAHEEVVLHEPTFRISTDRDATRG